MISPARCYLCNERDGVFADANGIPRCRPCRAPEKQMPTPEKQVDEVARHRDELGAAFEEDVSTDKIWAALGGFITGKDEAA